MAAVKLSFSCCKRSSYRAEDRESSPKHRVFTYKEIEAATSGFSATALLGRGSHGSVYLATLDQGRLVAAAKVPSHSSLELDSPPATDAEIDLLSSLPRSLLFVNLVGATPAAGPSPRIAVVDLMPHGSLHNLLHDPLRPPLPFLRRLRLALRSAAALARLHALRIAHRDLKPANLLIDARGLPRLADFGLAVRLPLPGCEAASFPPPAGTMGYLDPSYVLPEDISTGADVYSFGVVLFEVLSGREAIDVEYSPPSLVDWAAPLVEEGRLAELWDPRAGPADKREEEAGRGVAEVAGRCVAADAGERPSMVEVVAALRAAERRSGRRSGEREGGGSRGGGEGGPTARGGCPTWRAHRLVRGDALRWSEQRALTRSGD